MNESKKRYASVYSSFQAGMQIQVFWSNPDPYFKKMESGSSGLNIQINSILHNMYPCIKY